MLIYLVWLLRVSRQGEQILSVKAKLSLCVLLVATPRVASNTHLRLSSRNTPDGSRLDKLLTINDINANRCKTEELWKETAIWKI